MPLNLEEILALPDIGQKINYLKKGRKTELPDCCKLWDDWNPERHEIMVDKKKYPDRKVLVYRRLDHLVADNQRFFFST